MASTHLGRQVSDLMAYIFIPLVCVALPVAAGTWLLNRCAARGWVLGYRSRAAYRNAAQLMYIPHPGAWRRRWRLVELAEACDTWLCRVGRTEGRFAQVRVEGDAPLGRPGEVLIGLNWGTNLLALEAFRRAGLNPRLVIQPAPGGEPERAPFLQYYLRLKARLINRLCSGGVIGDTGAGLGAALEEDVTPVLLADTPPVAGQDTLLAGLLERNTRLPAEAMNRLAARRVRCTFYAMGLERSGTGRVLEFTQSARADDRGELVTLVANHFNRFVLQDSAQWRLWHAAGLLFDLDG